MRENSASVLFSTPFYIMTFLQNNKSQWFTCLLHTHPQMAEGTGAFCHIYAFLLLQWRVEGLRIPSG